MKVSMGAVALLGAGGLFAWSGFHGAAVLGSLKDLVAGSPASGTEINTLTGPVSVQTASGAGSANATAGTWTHAGLMKLWESAGGSASTAQNAACHAIQESSGNASVTSPNPDGGTNVGLWQLDTKGVGSGYSVSQLQNPNVNAAITVRGTKNGTDWSEWSTPGC
jgi:hypothetical protein